jgi:hypothetical protein
MATCRWTVAGSLSEASMAVARSARETVNPCGRLRPTADRTASAPSMAGALRAAGWVW